MSSTSVWNMFSHGSVSSNKWNLIAIVVFVLSLRHPLQGLLAGLGGGGNLQTSDLETWARSAHWFVHRPPGAGGQCATDREGVCVSLPHLSVSL